MNHNKYFLTLRSFLSVKNTFYNKFFKRFKELRFGLFFYFGRLKLSLRRWQTAANCLRVERYFRLITKKGGILTESASPSMS